MTHTRTCSSKKNRNNFLKKKIKRDQKTFPRKTKATKNAFTGQQTTEYPGQGQIPSHGPFCLTQQCRRERARLAIRPFYSTATTLPFAFNSQSIFFFSSWLCLLPYGMTDWAVGEFRNAAPIFSIHNLHDHVQECESHLRCFALL